MLVEVINHRRGITMKMPLSILGVLFNFIFFLLGKNMHFFLGF